ncbi:cyclopropane-fatty-acyl-phospholipid synthase family protein [Erythrobacter sp. T5W1-R]|uniref:cyclopropane-fatty-acyl-phospholipid synthase family protein n=1 Tax=Erythrobacter sp. T5W1-R TaxID=3101752 RepID=UPI002AFEA246|nr:cyclopropane-fatty-acyl-phospholipid synthase family protein [Erythrobacter sp. T5W1-R]MEA1619775.1 cyclopropane-fatty-acyl-phospholipid synthase family protein [Erythrobacter sp. T5W1-R]
MSKQLLDRFLSRGVRQGRLGVVFADGSAVTYGTAAAGFPDIVIRFADDRVPRDIVMDPRLGAAEAFMDGRLIITEGDVMGLIGLLRANSAWDQGGEIDSPKLWRGLLNRASFAAEQINSAIASKRNVAHHYDIGNALYALMLDEEHWQYSCAYWPRADMTLGEAQTAKLAHIAAKLAIKPGNTVLDIGCGWGGMAIYLAKAYDVRVTGITLSEEQAALAREKVAAAGLADRVSIELVDYRDFAAAGRRFDRIVSVGMFEHVGQAQFETFFKACANILADDGVMLLHTIGRLGEPGTTDAFTRKYIFPGGYIPALSETLKASEKYRLIASDIENLRLHYGRTLRQWYANCEANRDTIIAMYDERFYRMWTFYLAGAATVFEHGSMCNYQIQYVRSRRALPITRDYLAAEEARLLKT